MALSRQSVICRLSVTLLHPRYILERFGNICALPNSSGTRAVCVKILGKNSKGIVQVTYKGYKNGVFRPISRLYFENGTRYDHSYNGRRI